MDTLPGFVATALALRRSHPDAPPLDTLDLAMKGQQLGQVYGTERWLHPASPFGQLVAEALDNVMTPAEWFGLAGPRVPEAQQAAPEGVGDVRAVAVRGAVRRRSLLISAPGSPVLQA